MKTKLLFTLAAGLGAAAILWMGVDFVGGNSLALLVTAVIGFTYALGLLELVRFRRDTAGLVAALHEPLENVDLQTWLGRLPETLQNAVGQRIQGERVGLPTPVFTPYLVGLLVMLGLLGTFIGMVDTLQGAVLALEGSTELAAIRQGLAAPINGLSLAFGTSVAGIAASAMLGLNGTLSRRERLQATRALDRQASGPLREYSLAYNRQQTYLAMQQQSQALPQVAARLEGMAGELERLGQTISVQLLDNQRQFLQAAETQYRDLADSVGASLRESLASSGRLAGESIAPVVEQTLQQLGEHGRGIHEQLLAQNSAHLGVVSTQLEQNSAKMSASLEAAGKRLAADAGNTSGELVKEIGELLANTEELVQTRAANEHRWLEQQEQRMEELGQTLGRELSALRQEEAERHVQLGSAMESQLMALSETSGERLSALEAAAADNLARLGRELESPMTRLIETASETPRAAAEVIGKLREEVTVSLERDNALLEERTRIMQELSALTKTLQASTEAQGRAIEDLVSNSSSTLAAVSEQFHATLSGETSRLSDITADVADSTADMASLGEAFGLAVQLYSESNSQLVDNLSRIEASMEKSSERSDEQMSYYVAQAREIIDQSMLSQREIIEELRRLGQTDDLFAAEAG